MKLQMIIINQLYQNIKIYKKYMNINMIEIGKVVKSISIIREMKLKRLKMVIISSSIFDYFCDKIKNQFFY